MCVCVCERPRCVRVCETSVCSSVCVRACVRACMCVCVTSVCDAVALPPHAGVPQEPPLPLHPHLTLQVVLLRNLGAREADRYEAR